MKKKIFSIIMIMVMVFSIYGGSNVTKVSAQGVRYTSGYLYLDHSGTRVKVWAKFWYDGSRCGCYTDNYTVQYYGNVSVSNVNVSHQETGSCAYTTFDVGFSDGYHEYGLFEATQNGSFFSSYY